MNNLYLIGGGGHCRSCIDVIEQEGLYTIKGIIDTSENLGKDILGYKIIDTDENLKKYVSDYNYFLITVGQIKSAQIRMKIFEKLKLLNANMATIVSPRAYISKYATLAKGTIVLHDAVVNTQVKIGMNCIINTKSLIEHDSQVGSFCHVSTAAVVNGGCIIGDETFIGSNAVLKEGLTVRAQTIVPAGSFYNGK